MKATILKKFSDFADGVATKSLFISYKKSL